MNQYLKTIQDILQQKKDLSEADKEALIKVITDADKQWSITDFKLDRTEKVKKTTAILLEETITELEQKRKAVEEQNRELEVESSLEKVRTVAMGMRKRDDMMDICHMMSKQLESLGIKEIRNVQTAIFYEDKGVYVNYEYYRLHDKALVTEVDYTKDKISIEFAAQMTRGADQFFTRSLAGKEVKDWFNFQKTTNVFIDTYLETATSLTYYWFSLGPVAIGMSSYVPLSEGDLNIFKRFRNVFGLAYQRYIDIEQAEAQAREAQIELGLERVRARAMAMQNSDELKELICTVFIELTKLDLALTRCLIMIYDTRSNDSTWWMANSEAPADPIGLYVKHHQLPPYAAYISGWKDRKNKWQYTLEGKDKNDWDDFLFGETELSHLPDFVIAGMKAPDRVYLSASFNNFGCLNLASLEPLSDEHFDILLRFAKVFDLTYTRFNDLQKAEAQAREAEIQLALERVRAKSLAMHHTSELQDVVNIVAQQLQSIGMDINGGVIITINDEVDENIPLWASSGAADYVQKVVVPFLDRPIFTDLRDAIKRRNNFFIGEYSKKEKIEFFKDLFRHAPWNSNPEERNKQLLSREGGLTRSAAISQHTSIAVTDHYGKKFSDDENDILKRFGNIFEQSYTRFLDLQKAEAQAREAQIEAALERVRSKTMAMHNSQDVGDTVATLFDEFVQLGIETFRCGIGIIHQEKKMEVWTAKRDANGKVDFFTGYMDMTMHPMLQGGYSAWKKKQESYVYELKGDDLIEYFSRSNKNPNYPLKYDIPSLPSRLVFSVFYFPEGFLFAFTLEGLPAEATKIFKRFCGVFGQTYRRYLDLQKAEAQAREAKIEAALERTRTQSMIMQHSKELDDTLRVFHEQVLLLGINSAFSFLWLPDEEKDRHIFWAAWKENNSTVFKSKAINYPLVRNEPATAQCLVDWKGNDPIVSYHVPPSGVENYFAAWQELIDGVEQLKPEYFSGGLYYIEAFMKYGCFGVMVVSDLTEDEKKILGRFAIEFERTYTRFLDLQKAEAQAREAQIEAALERVRSRSLAMHKSDELLEVVTVIFEQLKNIGLQLWNCGIIRFHSKQSDDGEIWMTRPDGKMMQQSFIFPMDKVPVYKKLHEAWKNMEEFHVESLQDGEVVKHHNIIASLNIIPVDKMKQAAGRELPRQMFFHSINFSDGILGVVTTEAVGDETLLMRFGNTFKQCYTRFLDLQKAEAQAREAKIEAALEKVRSRTMAMQRSAELAEVATVLFQQVKALGVPQWTCGFSIFEIDDKEFIWYPGSADGEILPPNKIPLTEHPVFISFNESRKRGDELFVYEKGGEFQADHYRYMRSLPGGEEMYQNTLKAGITFPAFQIDHIANFSHGNLVFITYEHFPEMHDVFKRFAKVFEQTYTRFLDLQKAEAQAREAEIELSLERIRSKAMAMHGSSDILATTTTAFEELQKLGIHSIRCGIGLLTKNSMEAQVYASATDSNGVFQTLVGIRDMNDHPSLTRQYQSWLKQENFVEALHDEELKSYYNKLFFQSSATTAIPQSFDKKQYGYYFSFADGLFYSWSDQPYSENDINILIRFNAIVALTFRRFLDLQKAETQAREAQIEAALEKVRSRTMAMQKSEDLNKAASDMFRQIQSLGMLPWACGFNIFDTDEKAVTQYMSLADGGISPPFRTPLTDDPFFISISEARQRKEELLVMESSGKELAQTYRYMFNLPGSKEIFGDLENSGFEMPKFQITHCAYFSQGYLVFITYEHVTEAHDIFKRFAKVFEQTYTRFLDLKKAEAQAREATIEAALERVRSKTMAMHNSQDVGNTVATMFDQLVHLGVTTNRCGILIFSNTNNTEVWTAKSSPPGEAALIIGHLDVTIHPMLQGIRHAWKNKETFYSYQLAGDDIKKYYSAINNYPDYPTRFHLDNLPSKETHSDFFFPEGAVFAFTPESIAEEAALIFKRFAGVFGQTYRRYLDLLRAEAQTRQAHIETAMEKVRARALAMQKPEELVEVAEVLRKEMGLLGVEELETSSIYIHDEVSGNTECWYAIKKIQDDETKLVTDHMIIKLQDSWVGRQMFEFYHSNKKHISIPMQGENRNEWIHYCTKHSKAFDAFYRENIPGRTYHLNKFSNGYIGAVSPGDISAESWELLQRATSVFSLAYTRFSDLQKSEASAREAVRSASLDRVRAEIASMRTMKDLQRITPLIWNELMILNIPFIRCGVFIMDEEQKLIHTFLSTPDGKAIGAFHLPYTTPGNIQLVLNNWREKKSYVDHWNEDAFLEFADILIKQGAIASPDQYLNSIPHGGFHLHFLPFLQGMLYVGNTAQLGADEIKLIQSVADAFSTAYARYEDFNKLEAAKRQVDNTLNELQVTQKQLIQSEKMASLGELTAGIAHEIQNPLNFVNNFSDVSNELLEEMKTELEKGNKEDAMAIADDVKQNLEKILHHGKRADAIVKGMLQHSRTSSGQKELTDINLLADEYLRLAYHGLRAKDKSFNATLNHDFDKSVEKVNIIPQDIGRVLVNLINNAFYAVNEKAKQHIPGYEPTVSLTTKKVGDKVELRVIDNGNGIPQRVLDKIFQPFFTTKPTGQGTGLGLSLAYDIITKGHGGKLKVETKEGTETEFIIQLPAG